ncbi:MAG: hypothetical protein GC151_16420 [Betaproteobacteria bacterium]|nr:hypothetical protein [Betaproteobacteria bacterium]
MKAILASAFLLVASVASAQETLSTPDLPPIPAVENTLGRYPSVRAARDGVRAARADQRRLDASPYEYSLRGGYQSHSIPAGRYSEYDIAVERPLRLPGKARVDRELGAQNVELARRMAFSAWCDAARHLLQLWFAWAREDVQFELWSQQAVALREQTSIVAKRAKAGDAPRVEINLAEASAAQAEAQVENFRGREQGAREALLRTFPGITVPEEAAQTDPPPLDHSLDWFVDRVREHNDEIRVARAAAGRGLLLARRASADLRPDPAIGVRLAKDRSASDNIAGVYVTIPLPGQGRRAVADVALAQADVASSQEAATVQRVTADIAMMFGQARGAFGAWRKAADAADGMRRNASSMQRSWELREASLSDVLVARRLALESSLTAALARLDAQETRYRLLIEAHLLWNDPEEEAEPHTD